MLNQYLCRAVLTSVALTLLAGCGVPDLPTAQTLSSTPTQPALVPTLTGPQHDATKAALGLQLEHEIATYAALPSPTPGTLPTPIDLPTVSPLPTPPGGISFDCIDFLPQMMKHANCWFGKQNSNDVAVFAGSDRQEPTQGLIIVKLRVPGSGIATEVTAYNTPEQRGRIMLEQVVYPRFFLRADDGTAFIFNIETRQWEAAPAVPVPTATLLPGQVPYSTETPLPAVPVPTDTPQQP